MTKDSQFAKLKEIFEKKGIVKILFRFPTASIPDIIEFYKLDVERLSLHLLPKFPAPKFLALFRKRENIKLPKFPALFPKFYQITKNLLVNKLLSIKK